MKIYISGQITGLKIEDAIEKFNNAQEKMEKQGYEVVNPISEIKDFYKTWKEYMLSDIAMLLDCDSIYMLSNWINSVGAGIEHYIAKRLNKKIIYEKECYDKEDCVERIKLAIMDVIGLDFNEYITNSRVQKNVLARIIFSHYMREENFTFYHIASVLNRDHSTIIHYMHLYDNYYKYDNKFKKIADNVNLILDETKKSKLNETE